MKCIGFSVTNLITNSLKFSANLTNLKLVTLLVPETLSLRCIQFLKLSNRNTSILKHIPNSGHFKHSNFCTAKLAVQLERSKLLDLKTFILTNCEPQQFNTLRSTNDEIAMNCGQCLESSYGEYSVLSIVTIVVSGNMRIE